MTVLVKVIALKQGKCSMSRYMSERDRNLEREGPGARHLFTRIVNELSPGKADKYLAGEAAREPDGADLLQLIISLLPEEFERLGSDDTKRLGNLRDGAREAMGEVAKSLGVEEIKYVGGGHLNTRLPHLHLLLHKEMKDVRTGQAIRLERFPKDFIPAKASASTGVEEREMGRISRAFTAALTSRSKPFRYVEINGPDGQLELRRQVREKAHAPSAEPTPDEKLVGRWLTAELNAVLHRDEGVAPPDKLRAAVRNLDERYAERGLDPPRAYLDAGQVNSLMASREAGLTVKLMIEASRPTTGAGVEQEKSRAPGERERQVEPDEKEIVVTERDVAGNDLLREEQPEPVRAGIEIGGGEAKEKQDRIIERSETFGLSLEHETSVSRKPDDYPDALIREVNYPASTFSPANAPDEGLIGLERRSRQLTGEDTGAGDKNAATGQPLRQPDPTHDDTNDECPPGQVIVAGPDLERLRGALVIGLADQPSLQRLNQRLAGYQIEVGRSKAGESADTFVVTINHQTVDPRSLDGEIDFAELIERAAATPVKPALKQKEDVIRTCLQMYLATAAEHDLTMRRINNIHGADISRRVEEIFATHYANHVSAVMRKGAPPSWEEIDRLIIETAHPPDLERVTHLTSTISPAYFQEWEENIDRDIAMRQQARTSNPVEQERSGRAAHDQPNRNIDTDEPARSRPGTSRSSR